MDAATLAPADACASLPPPPLQAGAAPLAERNAALDILRLAAALVIVLFHAKAPGGALMPAAMGVFTAMAGHLAMTGRDPGPLAATARRRGHRLLRPLAVWGTLYLGLRLADAAASGMPLGEAVAGWLPPSGTMGPLWFLPFAFVATLAVAALRRHLPALAAPGVALPLAALASALWLLALDGREMPPGIAVLLAYEPSLFFGIALAAAAGDARRLGLCGATALALGLALHAAGIAGSLQLSVAVPLIAGALILNPAGTRATRGAADLSMAVYLLHVPVLAVMLRVLPFRVGSPELGLAGFALAAALGLVLLRGDLGRRLF